MADQTHRARAEGSTSSDADGTAADGSQGEAEGGDGRSPAKPALESLFVTVTGVEEVVAEQEPDRGGHLTDDHTDEIAAGARAVATDDGLRGTIDDAEPQDGQPHGGDL